MNILSVVSAKGGVGKTTVAANLAVALQMAGHSVLAVDLDPQNGLRYHFSLEQSGQNGLAISGPAGRLHEALRETASGVTLIPYGVCTEPQRREFESLLLKDPTWVRRQLEDLGLHEDAIVVLDTPPGPSVYGTQALTAATVVVVVVLPDAGSYITVPQMRSLIDTYCTARADFHDFGVIINQIDQSRLLGKDVVAVLRSSFGDRYIGGVHLDQSISESLAFGQSVFQYAPYSEGASDLKACSMWVASCLFSDREKVA